MATYYNAKNLPLGGRWDIAATNYGVTPQNAISKFGKIYDTRTVVDGGSKTIYDKMTQWSSPEAIAARGGNPNDTQWSLFRNALQTGNIDTRLNPDLIYKGLGLGLSETARAQQHKQSFWDSPFGMVLKFGAPLAAGAFLPGLIPGLTAGWAGAGAGALTGGLSGGWNGALLGGLSGYGGGAFGGAVKNAIGSTGGLLSSLSHPGDFVHNLWNGGPGAITSGAGTLPSSWGGTAGNVIGSGASAAGAIAPHIGSAGGNMGALGDFFSGAKDLLSYGDYSGGNIFGDALRGGIQYFTGQQAQNGLNNAAERLYANTAFNPYNINTPYGSAAFSGNNATATLSPEFQRALQEAQRQRIQLGKDAQGFNTDKFAQNYYNTSKRITAPEDAWTANDFLDKVYASGNMGSSTGAHDIFQFGLEKDLADQALRLQSRSQAGQEQTRLFNLYNNSLANEMRIAGIPNDQINLGLNAGSARSGANSSANQYPWFAAQNQADASAAFWKSLTDTFLPNGSITNKYGTPGATGTINTPSALFYDPNTGYATDLPYGARRP